MIKELEGVDYGILPQLVGYNLRRAYFLAAQLFSQRFADLNLTPIQFAILQILGRNDFLSQKAIAKHISTSPPAIVAPIRSLEKQDLVERRRSEQDRRNHLIRLTENGRLLQQQLATEVFEVESRLLVNLTPSEQATLLKLLEKLIVQ